MQNLVDLDRWPANESARFGQVKLTIAQFFRVSGGSTQHKGVVPDIAFPVTVDASEFGESTYDNALPWTRIAAVPHTQLRQLRAAAAASWMRCTTRASPRTRSSSGGREDVAQFRAEQAKKYVSLNEAERRAERDKRRSQAQAAPGRTQGAGPGRSIRWPTTAADDGLQASERDIAKDAAREKLAEKRPDPLLRESAAILADARARCSTPTASCRRRCCRHRGTPGTGRTDAAPRRLGVPDARQRGKNRIAGAFGRPLSFRAMDA